MLQNSVLKVVIKGSASQNFKSAENFFAYVLAHKEKKNFFVLNFF